MNLDLAYTGWTLCLLNNCARDWNHQINMFKNIIWKTNKQTTDFLHFSINLPLPPPPSDQNIIMKIAHINQKYVNTKSV